MDNSPEEDSEPLEIRAQTLQGLMARASKDCSAWNEQDFGPILTHQLNAPLKEDLSLVFLNIQDTLQKVSDLTFGKLLQHPHPPESALTLVKDFAKHLHREGEASYPAKIATVLYYASIAAAARAGIKITSLPTDKIREGCQWALNQTWLTPELKQLFATALSSTPLA